MSTKIEELSDEELIRQYGIEKYQEGQMDTAQMTEKILINSLYGALGNKHFGLYNAEIAKSITGNGRYFIQYVANKLEIELQKIIPWDNKYIVYGDTDSVVGDSIINTSEGNIKIEDLYTSLNGDVDVIGNDNFVKHINGTIYTKSVNDDKKVEDKQIKYIMKHKVKKRMYKISHKNREVVVTEDHSVIVIRDDEMISVIPKNILNTDKIMVL